MRTDKQLADALVERGIGEHRINPINAFNDYRFRGDWMSAWGFVNSWLVAGACMERAHMVFCERHGKWQVRYDKAYGDRTREWYSNESLPRAIIESFVEATNE